MTTINYAILGILSCGQRTGYDIKKMMQESHFMYWSGNNNQIYKALIELLREGCVTSEVRAQDQLPAKKVYTITGSGLDKLKQWVRCVPDPPEWKKTFLIQLFWSDLLGDDELLALTADYENEIKTQLIFNQEKIRRGSEFPARTPRELVLRQMVDENMLSSYQNELKWIQTVRVQLLKQKFSERESI